jgi:hypothetical protein
MSTFYAGLDLGQQNDRTALVVLQERPPETDVFGNVTGEEVYQARHIQRFQTGRPYTDMVEDVEALLSRAPLRGDTTLVIDATGVGRAVADLFGHIGRSAVNVTITGGQEPNRNGNEWTVPKRDIASTTQALLQTDRLQFSARVPETEVLVSEMKDFRVKVSQSGHATFEHREGKHDDLVLACALAAWYAEHGQTSTFTGKTITL